METTIDERVPYDPLFPVRLPLSSAPSREAIWLLLGPRPDTTLYGREELDAVRSTFPALTHAFTSAMAREALDAAVDQREKSLREAIADLSTRMRAIEAAHRTELKHG